MQNPAVRFIKAVVPLRAHDALREVRRAARRSVFRVRGLLSLSTVVTRADIADGLRSLGVRKGDVLMVHSSLRSMGNVQGGAEAVVGAFRDVIGEEGTLVVPTLTFAGDMLTHFEHYENSPFDARSTPSTVGKITEIVRMLPGAHRSTHPSHSAAAVGPQAEYITRNHHKEDVAFGRLSPYYRVCELGGKILMLGVELTTLTGFHVIEDIGPSFPYPVYVSKVYDLPVVDESGKQFRMRCRVHDPKMTAIRDCNRLEPYLRQYGVLKMTHIGEARALLLDGERFLPTMRTLVDIGVTIYNPRR